MNIWRHILCSWIAWIRDLILLRSPLSPNGDLNSLRFQSKSQDGTGVYRHKSRECINKLIYVAICFFNKGSNLTQWAVF